MAHSAISDQRPSEIASQQTCVRQAARSASTFRSAYQNAHEPARAALYRATLVHRSTTPLYASTRGMAAWQRGCAPNVTKRARDNKVNLFNPHNRTAAPCKPSQAGARTRSIRRARYRSTWQVSCPRTRLFRSIAARPTLPQWYARVTCSWGSVHLPSATLACVYQQGSLSYPGAGARERERERGQERASARKHESKRERESARARGCGGNERLFGEHCAQVHTHTRTHAHVRTHTHTHTRARADTAKSSRPQACVHWRAR